MARPLGVICVVTITVDAEVQRPSDRFFTTRTRNAQDGQPKFVLLVAGDATASLTSAFCNCGQPPAGTGRQNYRPLRRSHRRHAVKRGDITPNCGRRYGGRSANGRGGNVGRSGRSGVAAGQCVMGLDAGLGRWAQTLAGLCGSNVMRCSGRIGPDGGFGANARSAADRRPSPSATD